MQYINSNQGRILPASRTITNNLLLLDLDNTLTDTMSWFASFILHSLEQLAHAFDVPQATVNGIYAEVASATTLHEYAFVVETIAARLKAHSKLSFDAVSQLSAEFWHRFDGEHKKIQVYDGVHETLQGLRRTFANLDIVILTDSPEWVALDRLALTGLLPLVDGVVAIASEAPKLRLRGYRECLRSSKRRIDERQRRHDLSHLKVNMAIPATFAKPSSAGIELIASRLGCLSGQIVICGDKDTKEGHAAQNWRQRQAYSGSQMDIQFVKADYGNHDLFDERYQVLESHIPSLKTAKPYDATAKAPALVALSCFSDIAGAIEQVVSASSRVNVVA